MAQATGKGKGGGIGSAIGCLILLGALGYGILHFFPQVRTLFPGATPPIEWGQEYYGGGLRVKVVAAEVEVTQIEDTLGSRDGNEDLHVTLDIANLGDAPVAYKEPRLLGASEPKLLDDAGRSVPQAVYDDRTTVEGRLAHAQEIAPHDDEQHDLLFKVPPAGAKSFLLNVDMAMFGSRGVVQFRIPAEKIKGLR
ncbi:MAG: hypothetical protein L6Q95_06785 [Planctomycetes bacterium]|nr:hypothetical protein [Planctomycetota bacterium]